MGRNSVNFSLSEKNREQNRDRPSEGYFLDTGGIIMSSTGNLILAIMWILASPLWFFIENTVVGIIWLCAGIVELIIGLIRRKKEKKNK